jgi:hypothetical protein
VLTETISLRCPRCGAHAVLTSFRSVGAAAARRPSGIEFAFSATCAHSPSQAELSAIWVGQLERYDRASAAPLAPAAERCVDRYGRHAELAKAFADLRARLINAADFAKCAHENVASTMEKLAQACGDDVGRRQLLAEKACGFAELESDRVARLRNSVPTV